MSDLTGQEFGRLEVLARDEDYVAPSGQRKARWRCRCACGNEVIVRGTHLTTGRTTSCGCLRSEGPWRFKEAVGYSGAHKRVRRERGPASRHSCVDCGTQGAEWSYSGCDDEMMEDGQPYCPRGECYVARCVPCHRKNDLGVAA